MAMRKDLSYFSGCSSLDDIYNKTFTLQCANRIGHLKDYVETIFPGRFSLKQKTSKTISILILIELIEFRTIPVADRVNMFAECNTRLWLLESAIHKNGYYSFGMDPKNHEELISRMPFWKFGEQHSKALWELITAFNPTDAEIAFMFIFIFFENFHRSLSHESMNMVSSMYENFLSMFKAYLRANFSEQEAMTRQNVINHILAMNGCFWKERVSAVWHFLDYNPHLKKDKTAFHEMITRRRALESTESVSK